MDDECTEELGRPISSLKVSDLRDELAKRALIKTGKKNELIDRLRQAISKQSTSSQQSSSTVPADMTVQSIASEAIDSAIDYSNPQTLNLTMTSDQAPLATAAVVDYSSTKISSEQQIQDQPLQQPEGQEHQIEQTEPESVLDRELIQDEPSKETVQDEHQSKKEDGRKEEAKNTDSVSRDGQEPMSLIEQVPISTKADDKFSSQAADTLVEAHQSTAAVQDTSTLDEVEQSSRDETAKTEPESSAPLVFTIKRGNRDNAASRAEKRRKWSGKTESSQASEASLVLEGISSQKLQELIDLKQTKASESQDDILKQPTDPSFDNSTEPKQATEEQPATSTDNSGDAKHIENEASRKEGKSDEKEPKIAREVPDEPRPQEPTNWLLIKNLMRPYRVDQLKEELTKFGPIVEDKFWTDKVKSKCCVLYESTEAAQQTREFLQGQHWPLSNPKSLAVEFITEELYEKQKAADIQSASSTKNSDKSLNNVSNGNAEKQSKRNNERLNDRLDSGDVGGSSIRSRLGDKLASDVIASHSNVNRLDLIDSQPKELDDLFRKTKAKPQLFWLPLDEKQAESRKAEREERDKRAQESSHIAKSSSRRSPPPQTTRRRSPARRGSPRHRSPARRSPARRRSPVRRRTPPPSSRRSPVRRRAPPSPRDSRPPKRRSPPIEPSPLLRRRVSPRNSPPPMRRRTPQRDSPPFRRRSPIRESPPMRRRSPSPLLRRRSPPRDSPLIRRRSPEPGRRSPMGYNRRSPEALRRSPGPIRRVSPGRRSPGILRSPGMSRRSPGPIRRSPGLMRRSPGPIRRSPGPIRRSPGPMRRSPGPMRRSPGPVRRQRGVRDYD